jgi:hypothetical protein
MEGSVMKVRATPKPRLGPVIAEREYRLVGKDRKRYKVYLRVGKPRPIPGSDYGCVYQIVWPSGPRTRLLYGVDALQALDLALQVAHLDLVHTIPYAEGRLTWEGSYDLMLPVNNVVRDLIKKDPPPRRRRPAAKRRPAGSRAR